MRRLIPATASLLLGLLALSGCVSNEASGGQGDGPGLPALGGGTIGGTVADAEVNPLADARVGVIGLNLTTTTNDAGQFRFENVPPGTWGVAAEALGYTTRSKGVTVAEGQTVLVSFFLDPLPIVEIGNPVLDTRTFEGFISCSFSNVVVTTSPCSEACTKDEHPALPQYCTTPDPNDKSEFRFPIVNGTKTMLIEIVWDQEGTAGGDRLLVVGSDCRSDGVCGGIGRHGSGSPLRWELNATNRPSLFNFSLVEEKDIRTETYAYWELVPAIFVQFRFTMYVTTALYFEASQNYSALDPPGDDSGVPSRAPDAGGSPLASAPRPASAAGGATGSRPATASSGA